LQYKYQSVNEVNSHGAPNKPRAGVSVQALINQMAFIFLIQKGQ